jgi:MFS family permease
VNDVTEPPIKDTQFWKFRAYGFLKNLRFFEPFLLLFLRDAGLSFLAIGTLISIREIATNLLEIPTGVLADAFGRRKAMLFGFSAYVLSFVLFFLGSTYWVFVLAMLAFAAGETFRSGTHKAMILEHLRLRNSEDRKVFYYGKTRAASQFGSAIASLLAAGLVFWTGSYRVVFLASTVPYVLNLLLLASYPRALDGEQAVHPGAGWRNTGERFACTLRGLWNLVRDPSVLRGLLSGAGFDALFKSTKDYLQPILQSQALALPMLLAWNSHQRTAVLVGGVYFFVYLATSVASSHAGAIQDRVRSPALCINVTFFLGAALLAAAGAAAWGRLDGVAIIAFLGVYMIENVRRPMVVGYLADRMDHRMMASGLSVEVQFRTLIMAVIAPALGWLADRVGLGPGILLVSVAVLLAAPLMTVRDRSRA